MDRYVTQMDLSNMCLMMKSHWQLDLLRDISTDTRDDNFSYGLQLRVFGSNNVSVVGPSKTLVMLIPNKLNYGYIVPLIDVEYTSRP